LLSGIGHDVTTENVPFELTGWGKALQGCSLKEIKKAIDGIDFFYKVVESLNPDYIFDFHAADERVLNYHNLKPQELEFGRLDDDALAKRGGIPYYRWRDDSESLPNGYMIEVPQIFRKSSERFIKEVQKRVAWEIDYDRPLKVNDNLDSRFLAVCDRTKSLQKYPPDLIAETIFRGILNQILG